MSHEDSQPHDSDQAIIPTAIAVVTEIACALVAQPRSVVVHAESDSKATTLILTVAPKDYATVIGCKGRTAQSLRTVLYAVGQRTGNHLLLDIRPQAQP